MNDLNFFSPYQKTKTKVKVELKDKEKIVYIGAAAVVGIMIFVAIVQQVFILKYNSDINALKESMSAINNSEIQEIETKKNELDLLNSKYTDMKNIKNAIENLELVNDEMLVNIAAVIPDGIYFSGISLEKEEKLINGIAKNNAYIAEFQNNLRKLPYFKNLFVPEIKDNNGYYDFTIKIDAEDVK